ncbi:MAG: alpha/beta fold hydrolase [Rhizobiales bacterium]|nr:alpha/beta fold hydrolase [Hyphomicrobiales bacterium]
MQFQKMRKTHTLLAGSVALLLAIMLSAGGAGAESTADDTHTRSGNRQFEHTASPGKDAETVVILHGLGRSSSAMWMLAKRLEVAGYRTERFGYRSLKQTPDQIVANLSAQLARCCAAPERKVHFVGHSLGGLIARAFLARHQVPNLGRVVLLGTPSKGSSLADAFKDKWWFDLLGPTVQQLGTTNGGLASSLPPPDYPVGVIAGVRDGRENEDILPGQDDGLVTVSSTKFPGMTDFVVVPAGHSTMRYSKPVAAQVVNFLKTGKFKKAQ